MQTSAIEIKDKLLRALDQEYNVVDMATVLEVISLLEKTVVTKETLEKTRIGKYINELRKRTDNEQLARRAKDLVRSWRQLIPEACQTFNGKRVMGPTGPGPGSYPCPGNKAHKCTTPGSPRCKTGSPLCERSASPFCSSASSSPQSAFKVQGSNKPLTPTPTSKLNQINLLSEKISNQNNVLLNNAHNKINSLSNRFFKPVSPAMQTAPNSNSGSIGYADSLPQPQPQNPAHLNNTRSFCLTNSNIISDQAESPVEHQQKFECLVLNSPSVASGSVYSSLEVAKTNVANKRLRKSPDNGNSEKKRKAALSDLSNDCHIQNGTDSNFDSPSIFQNAYSSFSDLKCEFESEKRAKTSETSVCPDVLKDRLTSIGLGTKLKKVKTTQQLIEELQAKKDSLNLSYAKIHESCPEADLFIWKKSPNQSVPSELSKSKSELMKKFLLSSPESPSANSDHESLITDRVSSPCSDIGTSNSKSVITFSKDFCTTYVDPVDKEINQILSQLPPIDREVLNFEEDPIPERPTTVSDGDASRYLTEQIECINGNYDRNGIWRSWQESVERETMPGEYITILPYTEID